MKMIDAAREQQAAPKAKGEPTRPPIYHMETNMWTEFIDKDRARNHAYYLTVLGAEGDKVPPRIVAAKGSFNHLERVNGKGLIKLCDVSPQE